MSDGDNLQYCQHALRRLWDDPARGKVPIGWTFPPTFYQTMPDLAAYYGRTASANDEFIAGPSGGAYILPACWPRKLLPQFIKFTAEQMLAMQLDVLQLLDSDGVIS